MRWWDWLMGIAGLAAVLTGLWALENGRAGLAIEETRLGDTPASIVRAAGGETAGIVVIAHGFAGSRKLMEPFAFTLGRAGYLVVSFDFIGHGEHPTQLPARIEGEGGAAAVLIDQLGEVVTAARGIAGDPGAPYALLGHSMATDLLARAVAEGLTPQATVAVSLFSPEVTATNPPNMLIVTGGWEDGLTDEALRVVGLTKDYLDRDPAGEAVTPSPVGVGVGVGETVGRFEDATARRAIFPDGVEHIGVLYDPVSLQAARAWLDRAFDRPQALADGGIPAEPASVEVRGPLLAAVFFGMIALARPLSFALPRLGNGVGAAAGWWRLALLAVVPGVLTPLIVTQLPSGLMPIILGDYLAKHFLAYGLITWMALWWAAGRGWVALPDRAALAPLARPALIAALAVGLWTLAAFTVALERYAFSFVPTPGRAVLIPIFVVAFLPWFLADEWLTRGGTATGARAGAYALTKVMFVISLGIAVAIDPPRLFFLLIIAPVMLVFFAVYGVLSHWAMQRTGHPWAAGAGIAVALAWSVAVSFPLFGA
ncbi:MAG: alpha/beta hydrolase [Pseudomonadota bacterium]